MCKAVQVLLTKPTMQYLFSYKQRDKNQYCSLTLLGQTNIQKRVKYIVDENSTYPWWLYNQIGSTWYADRVCK